jgi:Tol biopolymer transport system component
VLALAVTISISAPALAEAQVSAVSRPPTSDRPRASTTTAPTRPTGWRTITLGRARFSVPESWPVVDLTANPSSCARFDVHAVYLGAQGVQPSCPAGVIGRTEAVQVQPTSERATAGTALGAPTMLGAQRARVARSAGISRAITATFPRLSVAVTATWGSDRALAEAVASSFSAAPVSGPTAPPPVDSLSGDASASTAAPRLVQPDASSAEAATASGYVGPGFDACTAPALSSMQAWLSSPFRAIGIYVGGANRACSQANLSASWVSATEGLGWNLMPLYVGLQAPCTSQTNLASISATRAAAQGRNAADDAVEKAAALGLGIGSPIYFDMEAYDRTRSGCARTVERFLSAWTDKLHAQRYVSGVYGSAGSTIAELVAHVDSSYSSPDDIWFAHWNGAATTFGDPYIPDSLWAKHQRIHQYLGGHVENHGGVAINIDSSQVDGAVIGEPAEGSFVRTLSGRKYRIAGGAPFPVVDCSALGGCRPIETLSSMRSLATYPANRTVITSAETGQIYVAAGGAALPVDVCVSNARCSVPIALEKRTIDSLANGHLRRHPKNGTELTGQPSGDIWRLRNGCRWPRTSATRTVGISDTSVDAMFPACTGELVYDAGTAGRRHLFSLRADGTHRSRITSGDVDDAAPTLSPDGRTVAFTRRMDGNADVWVINVDGTGLTRLTRNRAFDGFPSWSPDGASIAFQSDRGGSSDIWTMTSTGTHLVQLTRRRSSERRPVWSPGGSRIAFESDRDGSFDLWTMAATGGGHVQVTSGRGNDTSPSWSPDGLSIAFQSDRAGSPDIWTVGADGRGRVQLTRRGALDRTPAWSPDGGRIAFVSDRDRVPQLFVMHADGTVVLRYTSEATAVAHPRWSPQ